MLVLLKSRVRQAAIISFCVLFSYSVPEAIGEDKPPSLSDVKTYIQGVRDKMDDVSLDDLGERRYQGGNSFAGVASTMLLTDFPNHFRDFYGGGMRLGIATNTMCYRCGLFGCSFHPMIEYHYPYEMVEIAGMLQGQYTWDVIMNIQAELLKNFWYDIAAALTPHEIQRAGTIAKIQAGDDEEFEIPEFFDQVPGVSGVPSGTFFDTFAGWELFQMLQQLNQAMGAFMAAVPTGQGESVDTDLLEKAQENLRMIGALKAAGGIQSQYHFSSTLASVTGIPFVIPYGNCHENLSLSNAFVPMRSDSPLYIAQTHFSGYSDAMYIDEMQAIRTAPHICAQHNLYEEVGLPGPFSNLYAGKQMRELCVKALGAHYPITTRVANARSFSTAALNLILRGDRFFYNGSNKGKFAYYDYYRDGRDVDTLQIKSPSSLRTGYGFKYGDYGDFRKSNYRGGTDMSDPNRLVGTIWKYMRCCPFNMKRLWGPPELKGKHKFEGDELK